MGQLRIRVRERERERVRESHSQSSQMEDSNGTTVHAIQGAMWSWEWRLGKIDFVDEKSSEMKKKMKCLGG